MKAMNRYVIFTFVFLFVVVAQGMAEATVTELTTSTLIKMPTPYEPNVQLYSFAKDKSGTATRMLDAYYLFDSDGCPYFDSLYISNDVNDIYWIVQTPYKSPSITFNDTSLQVEASGATDYDKYYGRAPQSGITGTDIGSPINWDNGEYFTATTGGLRQTAGAENKQYYYGWYKIKRVRTIKCTLCWKGNSEVTKWGVPTAYGWKDGEYVHRATCTETKYYLVDMDASTPASKTTTKPGNDLFLEEYPRPKKFDEGIAATKYYNAIPVFTDNREAASRNYLRSTYTSPTQEQSYDITDYCYIYARADAGGKLDWMYISENDAIDEAIRAAINTVTDPAVEADISGFYSFTNESTPRENLHGSYNTGFNAYVEMIEKIPVDQTVRVYLYSLSQGELGSAICTTTYDPSTKKITKTFSEQTGVMTTDAIANVFGVFDTGYETSPHSVSDKQHLVRRMDATESAYLSQQGATNVWVFDDNGAIDANTGKRCYQYKANTGKNEQGKVEGRKVYITGDCRDLKSSGKGWMQPINTDIYLDGAKLQCADYQGTLSSIERVYNYSNAETINDLSTKDRTALVDYSTAVFYLPAQGETVVNGTYNAETEPECDIFGYTTGNANNTHIHVRDKCYLAGSESGKVPIKIKINAHAELAGKERDITILFYLNSFRHSAPIEIKDERYYVRWKKLRVTFNGSEADLFAWKSGADHWRKMYDEVATAANPIPQITCFIDADWADGTVMADGYLDLASALSSKYDNADGFNLTQPIVNWENGEPSYVYPGYSQYYYTYHPSTEPKKTEKDYVSFTPPLYTGGNHGHYVINGGHINLWPANSYAPAWNFMSAYEGRVVKVRATLKNVASYSNYLVCGSSQINIPVKYSGSSGGNLELTETYAYTVGWFINPTDAEVQANGIGIGFPVGSLTINGGTITMNTDPASFANYGGGGLRANEDASRGVIFCPQNVYVKGGTFASELASLTTCNVSTSWDGSYSTTNKVLTGKDGKTLKKTILKSTTTIATLSPDGIKPQNEFDYTLYDVYSLERDLLDARGLWIGDEETGYFYGMKNVKAIDGKLTFYTPSDANRRWVQNYSLKEGGLKSHETTPKDFDTEQKNNRYIYTLAVDDQEVGFAEETYQGVSFFKTEYRKPLAPCDTMKFSDGNWGPSYIGVCFPFRVENVYDAYGPLMGYDKQHKTQYGSYVEPSVKAAAWDNDNTWFYQYHMQNNCTWIADGHGFGAEYTTHATGDYFEAERPYFVRFVGMDWIGDEIRFQSVGGWKTIGATPTIGGTYDGGGHEIAFKFAGNNSLYSVEVNAENFPDGCFISNVQYVKERLGYATHNFYHVKPGDGYKLRPFETFLVGTHKASQKIRMVGDQVLLDEDYVEEATADASILTNGILFAYGSVGQMSISVASTEISKDSREVSVYSVSGELVYYADVNVGDVIVVPAAAGVYIVRSNGETVKVVVR